MTVDNTSPDNVKLDIPADRMPRHIAAIMDGNGRWAQAQDLPRIEGHQRGAVTVRSITEECAGLGIGQLTLYCLSSENWKRPAHELEFLMNLLKQYLISERDTLMDNNIALKIIGRRDPLPDFVKSEMDKTVEMTSANDGTTLCLAINYGSRGEIVDAVQQIARKASDNQVNIEDIDEEMISRHLYTSEMVDPDLLIRTAGEMRISNYLLWQISYSELWITEKYWPDFSIEDFHQAIRDFANRDRRFGGLVNHRGG